MISLSIQRLRFAALRIDIMTEHILAIDRPSIRRISIPFPICMEGWLPEESLKSRIRQPSRRLFQVCQSSQPVLHRFIQQLLLLSLKSPRSSLSLHLNFLLLPLNFSLLSINSFLFFLLFFQLRLIVSSRRQTEAHLREIF